MSDIWKDAPEGAEYEDKGFYYKIVNNVLYVHKVHGASGGYIVPFYWGVSKYEPQLTEKMTPRPKPKPEEFTLLEENTRQYKISNIGNILHNMSCSIDDENEQNELGGYASFMWDLADWFRDSAVGCSKTEDKPVYTNAMC